MRNGLTLLLSLFLLSSCSSSSGSDEGVFAFGGLWNVAFNSVIDECGLLEEGVDSFDDRQIIQQTAELVELDSGFLPTTEYSGSTRANDSFLLESEIEGDLFGDGISCRLSEALAYNSARMSSAEVVYNIRIECADGFVCNSALRGAATRELS